ncbi:zinc-ribbon-domain-containing protein [Gongronella butleri]|nr:zinc-ribbon-domain-containing protein [Gongronella butleri]
MIKKKEAMTADNVDLHTLERQLRKRILEVHNDPSLEPKEKASRIQKIMHCPMTKSLSDKNEQRAALASLTAIARSYHDREKDILGCTHYARNVKLLANCCGKLFPCRLCHDAHSDHFIIRSETKQMLCMECLSLQPVGQWCTTCGTRAAKYYCSECQFWDDSPDKSIYHCDDCGICRQGEGLGIDFHHCDKCNACMSILMKDTHKCLENNMQCNCPICHEYMFTSTSRVIVMQCSHAIHLSCYQEYRKHSYQCPICLKSLGDMSRYFDQLQKEIESQPMPSAYESYTSSLFCNDCERRSMAPYHFFYHQCQHCKSFNTSVLKTIIDDQRV